MESTSMKVTCAECGVGLVLDTVEPCARCGSKITRISLVHRDQLEFHDCVKGVVKDPSQSSQQRKRIWFFAGDAQRKSVGDWVEKDRVIDRDSDRYFELIRDKTTGAIIHKSEERLSHHTGHGSDKSRGLGRSQIEISRRVR